MACINALNRVDVTEMSKLDNSDRSCHDEIFGFRSSISCFYRNTHLTLVLLLLLRCCTSLLLLPFHQHLQACRVPCCVPILALYKNMVLVILSTVYDLAIFQTSFKIILTGCCGGRTQRPPALLRLCPPAPWLLAAGCCPSYIWLAICSSVYGTYYIVSW